MRRASNLVVGQSGTISYTIASTAPVALTGLAYSTNLPNDLDLDTVNSTTTCDDTPSVAGAVDRFDITDATLADGAACEINVHFTTNTPDTAGNLGGGSDFPIGLSSVTSNEAATTQAPDIGELTINK